MLVVHTLASLPPKAFAVPMLLSPFSNLLSPACIFLPTPDYVATGSFEASRFDVLYPEEVLYASCSFFLTPRSRLFRLTGSKRQPLVRLRLSSRRISEIKQNILTPLAFRAFAHFSPFRLEWSARASSRCLSNFPGNGQNRKWKVERQMLAFP